MGEDMASDFTSKILEPKKIYLKLFYSLTSLVRLMAVPRS